MMRNYNKLLLSLFFLSVSVASAQQKKETAIFLGDTVKIAQSDYEKLSKASKNLVVPLLNKTDHYIAYAEGQLSTSSVNFNIYNHLRDGVTKVLVIGNSFSDDGVESYLHEMARSTGKPLVIGNLFRGGAPLDFHLKNAMENNKIYSYRKTTIDGIKSNTDRTSILDALKDENWDYICFQQASVTSGEWSTVEESLPKLYAYVRDNYPVSAVRYLYHQTWAYGQNAVTANFQKYDRDQQLMYSKITDVSRKVSDLVPIHKIIPSGTAIQNGRTSYVGDNFNREAYHLDYILGRFTAASTWYETLFADLNAMNYKPSYLSDEQSQLAKEAAAQAVKNPFQITPLTKYQKQNSTYINFEKIKINFGSDLVIGGWLSLLYEKEGSGRFGILDSRNNPTSVNIQVLKSFDTRKATGPKKISFASEVPAQVAQTYFSAVVYKQTENIPFLRIENLHPNKKYTITVISTVAEKLETLIFNLHANKIYKGTVDPSFNRDKEVVFNDIMPTKDGKLEISFSLPNGKEETVGVINALIVKQVN